MHKVTAIGEEALIERLSTIVSPVNDPRVIVASGDDCAVTQSAPDAEYLDLLKTDCIVEGVHFLPGTEPERVGWKALCRGISDIAAMAGVPDHALVTLLLPPQTQVEVVEGWYRGMQRAADRFGISIVGGETSSQPPEASGAAISVALTGRVKRNDLILRSGARPGDLIGVTGKLGGSFDSGRHLDFVPRIEIAQWLAKQAAPTAMMDLSDGLAKDLTRLARASDVAYRIDPSAIPKHEGVTIDQALSDGEDYELLVTLPKEIEDAPVTIIGECLSRDHPSATSLSGGWDHFDSQSIPKD